MTTERRWDSPLTGVARMRLMGHDWNGTRSITRQEKEAVDKWDFRSKLINRSYNIWQPLKNTLRAEDSKAFQNRFLPPKKDPDAMQDEGDFEIAGPDAQRIPKPEIVSKMPTNR